MALTILLSLHCLTIHSSVIPAEQLSEYSGHKSSQGKRAQLLEGWSQAHETPAQGRMKPFAFTLHWKHNSPFVNTEGKQGSVSCFGGHQCMTDIHPKWRSCPVARPTDIFSSAQLAWSLSVLNFNEEKGAQRIFPTKIKLLKIWNWTCSDNFLPFLFRNYEYYIFNKYFVNKISSSAKFEWIRMRKFWP